MVQNTKISNGRIFQQPRNQTLGEQGQAIVSSVQTQKISDAFQQRDLKDLDTPGSEALQRDPLTEKKLEFDGLLRQKFQQGGKTLPNNINVESTKLDENNNLEVNIIVKSNEGAKVSFGPIKFDPETQTFDKDSVKNTSLNIRSGSNIDIKSQKAAIGTITQLVAGNII